MVAWGVVKLASTVIQWRARISYERARAAAVVDVLRAAPGDATVLDKRADGTMLCIEPRPAVTGSATARKACGGSVAEQR